MNANPNNNQLIIADAHVHIYDCFDLDHMLNSALNNFQYISESKGYQDNFTGILFLTETSNQNKFNQLRDYTITKDELIKNKLKTWNLSQTQENVSLSVCNQLDRRIFLIAGRQIVTAENLEVLALITNQNFEDGLPLKVTIQKIISAGGIPVLPWGVGKWMGRRGKLLNNLLAENNFPTLFLGDNGGRPVFWSRPSYFQQAETKGLQILPGTDPLPLISESSRPGSFGFAIQDSLNLEKPGAHIKQMLLEPNKSLEPYGRLENPFGFIRNQLAIRSEKFKLKNWSLTPT